MGKGLRPFERHFQQWSAEPQIPRLPRTSCRGLWRRTLHGISLKKSAHAALSGAAYRKSGYARDDTGSRPRFSAAPTALGSSSGSISQPLPGFPVELGGFGKLHAPFLTERRTRGLVQRCVAGNPGSGLGSRLADGPPGLRSMAIFTCHSSLNLPVASRLLPMNKQRVVGSGELQIPRLRSVENHCPQRLL
jgi:hypothetical protein